MNIKKIIAIGLGSFIVAGGIAGLSFVNVSHAGSIGGSFSSNCNSSTDPSGSFSDQENSCPQFEPVVSVSGDVVTITSGSAGYSGGTGTVIVSCNPAQVALPEGLGTNSITYSTTDGQSGSIGHTVTQEPTTGTCFNGGGQAEQGSLSQTFTDPKLSASSILTLTYKNSQNFSDQVTFNIGPVAPTVSISATPSTITLGSLTTLKWSSTNATNCTASGAWSGAQPLSDAGAGFRPTVVGNNTFTLKCTGPGGSASASASVNVTATTPTAWITATPSTITLGSLTTLAWGSTNVTSCTASGAWSGGQTLSNPGAGFRPSVAGINTFVLTCTGPEGSATANASVNVIGVGTITVNSKNAVTGSGVPATWDIVDGANDVCAENGAVCSGTAGTYSNQPAGSVVALIPSSITLLNTDSGQYSFNSIQSVPAIQKNGGVIDSMLAMTRNIFASTAEAYTWPPTNPLDQTLISGGTVSFIIVWEPIANMSVNPTSLSLSSVAGNSTSQQITVENSGSPGSTLTWTATSNEPWLTVSPSADGSGLTNGASGNASEKITIKAAGLSVGTYNGVVIFKGVSKTGTSPGIPAISLPVSYTVTNSPGGEQYYICTDKTTNTCNTTTTPGYTSCSDACGASGGTGTVISVTPSCTPSSIDVSGTSTCTAVVNGTGGFGTGVTWSTGLGTITATGNYSGPATTGTAVVTACSNQAGDTNICGTTDITIALPTCGSSGCRVTCASPLTANPSSIVVPESSNLNYSCSNATACTLGGGQFGAETSEPASDTLSVAPSSTTEYTLTCANTNYADDAATSQATVTVNGSTLCEQNPNGVGCPGQ